MPQVIKWGGSRIVFEPRATTIIAQKIINDRGRPAMIVKSKIAEKNK